MELLFLIGYFIWLIEMVVTAHRDAVATSEANIACAFDRDIQSAQTVDDLHEISTAYDLYLRSGNHRVKGGA